MQPSKPAPYPADTWAPIEPDWKSIKAFYARRGDEIMRSANEWGVAPSLLLEEARITMSPIEDCMWSDIRMEGAVLYPQYPTMGYFLDFANPVARVCIECDGAAFHLNKGKDDERDLTLKRAGWAVYRFTGRECKEDTREYFNEDGWPVIELADAQKRLRQIIAAHDIRIGTHRNKVRRTA